MFKLHKPQSIHSGHFMVSRLDDDDEDDNNDPADDSSESERDNANNVEIDVNNPESVVDADNLSIKYQVESPSAKDEQLTSWNDLDRPAKHSQKYHQYLTYYTNSYNNNEESDAHSTGGGATNLGKNSNRDSGVDVSCSSSSLAQLTGNGTGLNTVINTLHHSGDRIVGTSSTGLSVSSLDSNKESLARGGTNSHLNHLHQHHHLQDQQLTLHQNQCPNHLQLQHQHQQLQQYQMSQAHHHHQHAVTIDTSLTKLLECMSLYYSSKLTSPKWKSFKGLKLRLKYKIRLNNLIWRAWFLQCIRGRRPPGCQFTAPVETDVHKKSETIVLEGKYWKRKEKAIVDEYKKWRTFHKQKSQMNCFRPSSFDWDSRVSNLASSSAIYQEYHFHPDYDMNITYNLDDLPMIEEIETREADCYYPSQPSVRMLEQPQPQSQQQHQQHQTHHQLQPHQQQLAQLQQVTTNNNSQQAISLKREQPVIVSSNNQQSQHFHSLFSQPQTQHHHQQQQQQQQQQQHHHHHQQQQIDQQPIQQQQQRPPTLPFNFDSSPFYQQINDQLQQQQQVASAPNTVSPQQQHQQNVAMSISQELYPLGGGQRSEQRRVCHINAEQKRRCNIKNGFDTLKSILPSINQNVNVKISKASMLQKAALYISSLSTEQKQQADEQAMLKQQIESLKQTISAYQSQLPASGGPVGCQGSTQAKEMLQDYIRTRTNVTWKFWIFSLLIERIFESYYSSVNVNSFEDSIKSIFTWLDRNCGLVSLRKDVLESLTFLSTSTNILNTPQTLPTEAVDAVRYQMAPTTSGSSAPLRQPQQHPQLPAQHSSQHQQLQPPPPPPPPQQHQHQQQLASAYARVNLM